MHGPGYMPLIFGVSKEEGSTEAGSTDSACAHDDHQSGECNTCFAPAKVGDIYVGYGRSEHRLVAPSDASDDAEPLTEAQMTRRLMRRLAARMTTESDPTFWKFTGDNDNLPAGYTYLLQLVAHDLVANVAPLSRVGETNDLSQRDVRSERMILDTIYGGGPAINVTAYAMPDQHKQRVKLRVGKVYKPEEERDQNFDRGSDQEFAQGILEKNSGRDIPRATCPFVGDGKNRPTITKGFTDPLIADPRNDNNLILSQLTALFHEFHNLVVDQLEPDPPQVGEPNEAFDRRAFQQFLDARRVVAFVYRKIVMEDLLKRILDETIYERAMAWFTSEDASTGPTGIRSYNTADPKTQNRVPTDFSHAVFRVGHALVRHDYIVNKVKLNGPDKSRAPLTAILDRTCHGAPYLTPISSDWLVDWDLFFQDAKGDKFATRLNFSRRLVPDFKGGGLAVQFPVETGNDGGLFYRDLLRGVEVQVSTVKRLIDLLPDEDRNREKLLRSETTRCQELKKWLEHGQSRSLSPTDSAKLASDPPLYLFTLFEAAHTKEGKRFGFLGSVVLAEVIFTALRSKQYAIELDAEVQERVDKIFGLDVPTTMLDLVAYIKNHGGLIDAY